MESHEEYQSELARARRPWGIAALGVLAYHLGLGVYVVLFSEMSSSHIYMLQLLGAPVTLSYAVLLMEISRRSFVGGNVPAECFVRGAIVVGLLAVVFIVASGWIQARGAYVLGELVFFLVMVVASCVAFPFTLPMHIGQGGMLRLGLLVAIGVPSVGPIILIVLRARGQIARL